MTNALIAKFEAAKSRGLKFFYAHVNGAIQYTIQWVGSRWEEEGFECNTQRKPLRHYNGCPVVGYGIEDLNVNDSLQWQAVETWYEQNA